MKKNWNSIDLTKFVFAIVVIAIHTNPLEGCSNAFIIAIYECVARMAVPFFFISSGYLLSKKMIYPFSETDLGKIKKQLIKIIEMYVLWSVIYAPLTVINNISQGVSFSEAFKNYGKQFVFFGEQCNAWHLWYLLSTIWALIIIIILIKLKVYTKYLIAFSAGCCFISMGTDWVLVNGLNNPICVILRAIIANSVINGRVFQGMIYIPLGMYLAHKTISLRISTVLFVLGFALEYVFYNSLSGYPVLAIMMIGFWGIIEQIKIADSSIFPLLRQASTIIYLIHMYIRYFYITMLGIKNISVRGMNCFLFTMIASVGCSFLYIKIYRRLLNN